VVVGSGVVDGPSK